MAPELVRNFAAAAEEVLLEVEGQYNTKSLPEIEELHNVLGMAQNPENLKASLEDMALD